MDISVSSAGLAILLTFCLCGCINAYPDGKVEASCNTLLPNHGVSAQTSSAPYTLTVSKTTYNANDQITVTLAGSSSFKGFLIQARSGSSAIPQGSFQVTDSSAQALTCTTAASTVSQTSSSSKSSVQVKWTAPSSINTDIQLRATVVRSEKVFWSDIFSCSLKYNSTSSSISGTSCSGSSSGASNISYQTSASLLFVLILVVAVMWL